MVVCKKSLFITCYMIHLYPDLSTLLTRAVAIQDHEQQLRRLPERSRPLDQRVLHKYKAPQQGQIV